MCMSGNNYNLAAFWSPLGSVQLGNMKRLRFPSFCDDQGIYLLVTSFSCSP